MRLHELTIAAALPYRYGCVASQMRLRESVIHVSLLNKVSNLMQALQHIFSQYASAIRYESVS